MSAQDWARIEDSDGGLLNRAVFDDSDDHQAVNLERKNSLTLINTNARSLCPKVDSLIDCFHELSVDVAIVTEMWLKNGPELDQSVSDLELGFQ